MESLNPDTGLKNRREVDNLSTEFGKLSLAEVQQILDDTNSESSDISDLSTPNNRQQALLCILKTGIKEMKKDFNYINQHMYYLNRNIYQSSLKCKRNNNTPKTIKDLEIFRDFVKNHAKFFANTEQWSTLVDYVFLVWKHVNNIPTLINNSHTNIRSECFCYLLRLCLMALINLKNTYSKEKKEQCLNDLQLLCDNCNDDKVKWLQRFYYEDIRHPDHLG